MKWQHLAILALLLSAACLPSRAEDDAEIDDDDEDEDDIDRAFLLVRRVVADERPLEGKQTTVTISIYNAGKATATDVQVEDQAWPEAFAVVGSLTAKFDRIPEGSSVEHSYKVTSKSAGLFQVPATRVSYVPAEGESVQSATSSALAFRAFTVVETLALKALELGSTLSGGNLNTAQDWKRLGYFSAAAALALVGYRSYSTFTESSRNRKRAKALAALGELEKTK